LQRHQLTETCAGLKRGLHEQAEVGIAAVEQPLRLGNSEISDARRIDVLEWLDPRPLRIRGDLAFPPRHVERGLERDQRPIHRHLARALGVGAVERRILLFQPLARAQPRRCLGHVGHPLAQPISRELGHLDVAEHGTDERAIAVASISAGLLVMVEIVDVCVHRIGHDNRAMLAVGAVRALHHGLARLLLRLPEVEDGNAVSIGYVVGGTDALDLVLLFANVVPSNPCAGLPITEPAIAEVKPTLDRAVVRLAPDLEPAPSVPAVEPLVENPTCHVQYLPKLAAVPSRSHSDRWTRSSVYQQVSNIQW